MKEVTIDTKQVCLHAEAYDYDAHNTYKFHIEFFVFQDTYNSTLYNAYCPSLELATTGRSVKEAIANFYECFQLHVEGCIEMGTLFEDLEAHGYKITKEAVTPPPFKKALSTPEMKKVIGNFIDYHRLSVPVCIPNCA